MPENADKELPERLGQQTLTSLMQPDRPVFHGPVFCSVPIDPSFRKGFTEHQTLN